MRVGLWFEQGRGADSDQVAARHWFNRAAQKGHPDGQFHLGRCLENGIGGSIDLSGAVTWYQKAVDQGHAIAATSYFELSQRQSNAGNVDAQYHLGRCHEHGIGTSVDTTQALSWYQKSVDQGHASASKNYFELSQLQSNKWDREAQLHLGRCFEHGIGTSVDTTQALSWYQKSADHGHPGAQYHLGRCHEHGIGTSVDTSQALGWYQKSVDQGHASASKNYFELSQLQSNKWDREAQFHLGRCYEHGIGTSVDTSQALGWYQKAVDQGHASASKNYFELSQLQSNKWDREAQLHLGRCFEHGIGTSVDTTQALSWYQKSADHGHPGAQYHLGRCFEHGIGTSVDTSQALGWYQKAVDQGHASAAKNYFELLQRQSDERNVDAQYHLGRCFEYAIGTPIDPVQALTWYQKAADRGHANAATSYFELSQRQSNAGNVDAQLHLGRCHEHGIGTSVDTTRALGWYQKSADHGHPGAQFHLGRCHEHGIGTSVDTTRALGWYQKSADQGHASAGKNYFELSQLQSNKGDREAQFHLGRCHEYGIGTSIDTARAMTYYKWAADQGHDESSLSQTFLHAWACFLGLGLPQSDSDAFNSWQDIHDHSNDPIHKPIATHMLGWMFYLGRGTERDQRKGIQLIRDNQSNIFPLGENNGLAVRRASFTTPYSPAVRKFAELCQLGSTHDWLCNHLFAVSLAQGFGIAKDVSMAASIFEQLAKDGHSDSQVWIGACYYYGCGVPKNDPKAFEWFSKSADQNNSYGQWMMGRCSLWGYGVRSDPAAAISWFQRSADQGNRYGQTFLGQCYENSLGVTRDIDKAIEWYRKAAEQGYQIAQGRLEVLLR
ncbi:uncharacterized protein BJ171DRAFT_162423 [Polychytrium aggregatum]|uniref:uncharacterized protein n=1 Tax=Polychytrium aggregatum TaxID=110093 RepID=UPI0022FE1480|nr:uncharacterized protein BJ171DRAFT_162423 [Polychytrium aggregatum]KAI9202840.1 hypothetical protein BJ171DRAFT_162423 [Polychytrium aggregatum]